MKAALLFILLGCASGCGPNLESLKWRASHDLNCGQRDLVLTPLDEDGERWGMRGCQREAAYVWSSDSGKNEWVMVTKPVAAPPNAPPSPPSTGTTPASGEFITD